MQNPNDFLKHFDTRNTPKELVKAHYDEYLKSGDGSLSFKTSGKNDGVNRARVKMIKGCECEICGLKYYPVLQVHHTVPLDDHGTINISNLAVLCGNCHTAVHRTIESRDFGAVEEMFTVGQYRKFKRFVNYKK